MKHKAKILFELASSFFRIGLFTFGGGYAMLPLMEREVVEGRKWINENDVLDILAIAESTPGPLAVNMATFVGYRMAGIFGAISATGALALPSVVIITIISVFFSKLRDNLWFGYVFKGIRSGVLMLMLNAVIKFGRKCPKKLVSFIMLFAAFAIAVFTDVDIAFVILGAGLLGIIYHVLIVKDISEGEEK